MRVLALIFACCLTTTFTVPTAYSAAQDAARAVAERVDRRDTGRDSRTETVMRLFDRQGRVRERTLVITTLRGAGGAADRSLIRFLSPNDIKGTGLLIWEHEGKDDERFLFLPALGRVRRIAGAEKQESFVGSDLSYEDLGGRDLNDYRYSFVQESAEWTAPDGQRHAAWQLESRAVDPGAAYPRSVSFIRKDALVVVSAEIYNRRNEREKQFEVRELRQIDGIWTATQITVVNEIARTRTELSVKQARYNIGLTERDFTRRELEQSSPR